MNSDLAQLIQLTLNGVAIGAIYALVALGLVLTYKATEVLNFAHGDVLMASSFVGWGLIVGLGWPFWLATLATVLLAAALSWLIDARIMRMIVGQPQFAGVMLTIAIAFMLRGLVSMFFGPDSRTYPTPWTGQKTQLGTLVINDLSLAIVGSSLLITLVLFWFLKKTALGTSIQAKRVTSMVWAISGAIAAVCGLLLAPIALVDIGLWIVVLKALAALVLGGFGSVPGAILGGLLLGVIEQFSGVYLPDGFKDAMAYIVLIGVLILWPRGLLGEAHGRRV